MGDELRPKSSFPYDHLAVLGVVKTKACVAPTSTDSVQPVTTDEIVQYILVRGDLGMPKGKLAAQVGHAVQLAIRTVEKSGDQQSREWMRAWEAGSYAKIVLRVDELQLDRLRNEMVRTDVLHAHVVDEGRTVLEPGTTTAVALAPMPRAAAPRWLSELKLL